MSVNNFESFNEFALSQIKDTKWFYDDLLTICVITTLNDFKIVDQACAISKDEYEKTTGRQLSYNKALNKLFNHTAIYCNSF